ncbi:MAG TPA: hypothetical protein VFO38_03510 [Candidatus Saccharimonadales bacterium]|nr:hypothetical protein [Candidatus Saccharimonadales bacterium]
MLSSGTKELIHGFSPVPALVAYGVLTLEPTVERMLQTHAKRYQRGEEYAPHNHALAVVKGWTEALLDDSSEPQPAAGYAQHERTGVNARPDLLYMVGAMLTTFWVQHSTECGNLISQGAMAEIENAFFRASYAYGVGVELIENISWPSHQAAVSMFMHTIIVARGTDESYAHAVDFWQRIVEPIGGADLKSTVAEMLDHLTPRHVSDLFLSAKDAS